MIGGFVGNPIGGVVNVNNYFLAVTKVKRSLHPGPIAAGLGREGELANLNAELAGGILN